MKNSNIIKLSIKNILILFRKHKMLSTVIENKLDISSLTPKGPLSLQGTNGISGRYLRADFLS